MEDQQKQQIDALRAEAGELALENRQLRKQLDEQSNFLHSAVNLIVQKAGIEVGEDTKYSDVLQAFAEMPDAVPDSEEPEPVSEESAEE